MNRIEPLLPAVESPTKSLSTAVESGLLQSAGSSEGPLSLFVPLHYEPNYAYPLLIWLHGSGENEQQLKRIIPLISIRNYVAIAPRGMTEDSAGSNRRAECSWPVDSDATDWIEQRVFQCLEHAQSKANIARHRVFLAGHGSGGTAALRVVMRHPRRFAGVLSLAGAFPSGGNPLASLAEARRIPVFLACGQAASRYSAETVCDDLKLLHSAGMSVSLRVYPGNDDISPLMLADMDRWMMELITGNPVMKTCQVE